MKFEYPQNSIGALLAAIATDKGIIKQTYDITHVVKLAQANKDQSTTDKMLLMPAPPLASQGGLVYMNEPDDVDDFVETFGVHPNDVPLCTKHFYKRQTLPNDQNRQIVQIDGRFEHPLPHVVRIHFGVPNKNGEAKPILAYAVSPGANPYLAEPEEPVDTKTLDRIDWFIGEYGKRFDTEDLAARFFKFVIGQSDTLRDTNESRPFSVVVNAYTGYLKEGRTMRESVNMALADLERATPGRPT